MTEEYREDTLEEKQEKTIEEENEVSEKYLRAGFWMRFWAYSVDILATFSLSAAILSIYYLLTGGVDPSILAFSLSGILSASITFLYFILLTRFFGQTLGKMLFGLKVVSKTKEELSWTDIIFREFVGRFLHRFLVVTNVLYLIVAFHPEKRGLHDFLGNSVVILEKRKYVKIYREQDQKQEQMEVSPSV